MPNIVRNGDFERGLDEWTILPVEYRGVESIVRIREAPAHSRGASLYFQSARYPVIEQRYPWAPCATEGELSLQVYGYGADFYVSAHYADGGMDDAHFYGHFDDGWERLAVPVANGRPIERLEIYLLTAIDFYIDDISLQGINTEMPWRRPEGKRPPEEFNEPPLLEVLERRLIGIERQINRLTTELAKHRAPDLAKQAEKRQTEQHRKVPSSGKETEIA